MVFNRSEGGEFLDVLYLSCYLLRVESKVRGKPWRAVRKDLSTGGGKPWSATVGSSSRTTASQQTVPLQVWQAFSTEAVSGVAQGHLQEWGWYPW